MKINKKKKGIGCRKCLGAKLAMSQIKLMLIRLLQSYQIERVAVNLTQSDEPTSRLEDSIETKDILFAGPIGPVNVSIQPI